MNTAIKPARKGWRALTAKYALAAVIVSCAVTASAEEYTIAVLNSLGRTATTVHWRPLAAYLTEQMPGDSFRIQAVSADMLSLEAQRAAVDFIITDPASFVEVSVNARARAILSAKYEFNGTEVDEVGAVIFTSSYRAPVNGLLGLKGRTLVASRRRSFEGWHLAAAEFSAFGTTPEEFLRSVRFIGGGPAQIVAAVHDGLADVGIVPAGALEILASRGIINLSEYNIVAQRDEPNFPFATSTPLYPGWVLAALPWAPDDTVAAVTKALLSAEPHSGPHASLLRTEWEPAYNYNAVREFLKAQYLPPYTDYASDSLKYAVLEYLRLVVLAAMIIGAALMLLFLAWRRGLRRIDASAKLVDSHAKSSELFRHAAEDLNVFYTLDPEGHFTHVNERFTEVTQYSAEEVLGKHVELILEFGLAGALTKDDWRALYAGTIWTGGVRFKRKDGEPCWVKCSIVPIFGECETPSEFAVFATDVTSLRAEEAQAKFTSALDMIEDEVYVFRPGSMEILFINEAGRLARGWSPISWKGATVYDFRSKEGGDRLRKMCDEMIRNGEKKRNYEAIKSNGSPHEVEVQVVRPSGEDPMIVFFYRDISARKAAEKAKAEFVSTVSHELRTPLTSIKGALGLALSGSLGDIPAPAGRLLDIAHNNCDRLTTLINDILDLEKLSAGKMEMDMQPVDLAELVAAACESNKAYGEKYDVSYVVHAGEEPVKVSGDGHRLMQVMDNLMSNAAKFSKKGGKVELTLSVSDDCAKISIRDFGDGIPKKAQATIFDKFTQADSSDTRAKGGTGLGLSIAKRIVEAHGGRIAFTSEGGEGTEFTVEIPLLGKTSLPAADSRKQEPKNVPAKGRILVCEDDTDMAMILRGMLERQGYEVVVADTGIDAQKLLADGHFDGMTLDLGLPDKDGMTVLRELLEDEATCDLPVVVVSANTAKVEEGRSGALADKATWLEKPILQPLLNKWLERVDAAEAGRQRTILHVDADDDMREVVCQLVGATAKVVGARTLREAQARIREASYDLVILETALPDGDGSDLIPMFAGRLKDTPLMLFSIDEGVPGKAVSKALVKSRVTNPELKAAVQSAMRGNDGVVAQTGAASGMGQKQARMN